MGIQFVSNTRALICLGPLVSGVLYALANVGFGLWPLAFVMFIPLWLGIDAIADNAYGKRAAAGFLFGLTAFLCGTHWLLVLNDGFIEGNAGLGLLLWLGLGVWFALAYAIYALAYRALKSRGFSQLVSGTAPLILLEWLQFNLFPAYAGAGLIHRLELAQLSSLGGPLLMSAFVVSINCCLYSVFTKSVISKNYLLTLSLGVLLIALAFGYGLNSLQRFDALASADTKKITIGVVQSNLVRHKREESSVLSHEAHLQQSRELLSKHQLDLLIWPESAYESGLRRPLPLDGQFIRKDIDVPLLFGGTSIWQSNGRKVASNSVFLLDQSGKVSQSYDKNMLLPIAETRPDIPFIGDTILDFFPQHQDFVAGTTKSSFKLGGVSFSVPICYEMVLPDYIHSMVEDGQPDFLVTLANDAWFSDSQEPEIHLALSQSRAIEHRVWVIRSTNSGVSAVIDPAGRIVARTAMDSRENMLANVTGKRYFSWYSHYGNWPVLLVLLIAFFDASRLILYANSRRQRSLAQPKTT